MKQYLLKYDLGRRSDEGRGYIALVSAVNLKEAEDKLIKAETYQYTDAISNETIKPRNINCLNID